MIDARSLDLSSLPSVPLTDRANLPPESAVYFVTSDEGVAYVGRTASLLDRFKGNHTRQHQFEELSNPRICWLSAPRFETPSLEHVCIEAFQPSLNKSRIGMSMAGTTGVFVRLPQGLYDWLVVEAKGFGSVPAVVRSAIREYQRSRS